MRAVIFVLILAVVVVLIAIATGYLDIHQTRTAKAPNVSVNRSGVAANGGRTPAFDIETGTVSVGTAERNVSVPTVKVTPPPKGQRSGQQRPRQRRLSSRDDLKARLR